MSSEIVEGQILRQGKAIWKSGANAGGTLTLQPGTLSWKRSGWAALTWNAFQAPAPQTLQVALGQARVSIGPRKPNWIMLIFAFAVGLLLEFASGGLRETLCIETPDDTYFLSVADLESWLNDLEDAGAQPGY